MARVVWIDCVNIPAIEKAAPRRGPFQRGR
jgi:hypothetical protein